MLFSCSNRKKGQDSSNETVLIPDMPAVTHEWFYFSKDGFSKIDLPQNAPKTVQKPWTEAVRISSAVTGDNAGFFTVNKKGLLILENGAELPELKTDSRFFQAGTVGKVFLDGENPVFHLYKNSFFTSENQNANSQKTPFAIEYKPETSVFYPILYKSDLGFSENCEINDFFIKNKNGNGRCYISKKEEADGRIDFSYYSIDLPESFASLALATGQKINASEISVDDYRKQTALLSFSEAPERVKKLLNVIPESFPFIAVISDSVRGETSVKYLHGSASMFDTEKLPVANVLITDTFTVCVFSDGTTYFSGALAKGHIVNSSKTICFRLPLLPAGFTYGDFCIEGERMLAAWEESSFYETARTGFILVNLDKVLKDR